MMRRSRVIEIISVRNRQGCGSVLLLSPYSSFADFTGQVVSVLDGDTIEVLNGHHAERIRLSGIDCPEYGQTPRLAV